MSVLLKVKRGTQAQIEAGSLALGELALSTDLKHVMVGDGVGKVLAGKALIDTFANRPAAGVAGRWFYASDTGALYLDSGSAWIPQVSGAGGLASSRNIYISFGSFEEDSFWWGTEESYFPARWFPFLGTDIMGTPTSFKTIGRGVAGATGYVQLWDETNYNQIGEVSTPSGSFAIQTCSSLSNLPAGEAMFRVETKTSDWNYPMQLCAFALCF